MECGLNIITAITTLPNGMQLVKIGDSVGVLSCDNEVVIQSIYDDIELLGGNLFRLRLGNLYGLVDEKGKELIPQQCRAIEYATNGIYAIYIDNWEFVDSYGKKVSLPSNILLYSTRNECVVRFPREIWHTNNWRCSVSYMSAFGYDRPIIHNIIDGNCIMIFPDKIKIIGERAFYGCDNLTNITIPDSVTNIGISAFKGCKSLTTIKLPKNLKHVVSGAFSECSNLYKFDGKFSDSEGRFLIVDGILCAYAEASGSTCIIPNEVTGIGYGVFMGCERLVNVEMPNSVTIIGDCAFYGCSSLQTITISNSLAVMGYYAFSNCKSLITIELPCYIDHIGNYAFKNCKCIEKITIPNKITKLGREIFSGCTNLKEVNIPNGVDTIEYYAFKNCISLQYINLPNSITSIMSGSFYGCENLVSITIPKSVIGIGKQVFSNCHKLSKFNGKYASKDGRCLIVNGTITSFAPANISKYSIPDEGHTIGEYAFEGMMGLKNIDIPNNIKEIQHSAFVGCEDITSVAIPSSVTKIGNYTFLRCKQLTTVYCKSVVPPTAMFEYGTWDPFHKNSNQRKIYVPNNSVEMYKTAAGWNKYSNEIIGYDICTINH